MSKLRRIDFDRYALCLAWMAAQRSEALSTNADDEFVPRKVGAAVLSHENRVLSLGYNGFAPGYTPSAEFYRDPNKRVKYIVHAETNALVGVKRGEARTIAVTLSPCAGCAQQIVAQEIKRVIYGEEYKDREGLEILHFANCEIFYFPIQDLVENWIMPAVEETRCLCLPKTQP